MTSRMIAGLFVKLAAPFHAEALGHRDLHVLDVVTVPDRLEERVRESEVEDVLNRFLPEIVIDAEDRLFREVLVEHGVELACRCEVATERLFDDDPCAVGAVSVGELTDDHDGTCSAGSPGSGPAGCSPQLGSQLRERVGVVVVAVDVAELRDESGEGLGIVAAAVLGHRRASAFDELIERPSRPGHTDHQAIQLASLAPWPAGQERSSCTRGHRLRRRTRARPSGASPSCLLLLDVAAETEAHRGEHLVLEEIEIARREPLEERGRQHERRHALVVRRRNGPAAFARVRDTCRRTLPGRDRRRAPAR